VVREIMCLSGGFDGHVVYSWVKFDWLGEARRREFVQLWRC
jgi:hypothetical protein